MYPQAPSGHDDVVVVVPTYNERDTLPVLVAQLLALPVAYLRVLVVDDNSPDGTGAVADELAARTPGMVEVLHRQVKDGLGRAYVCGMRAAVESGAAVVIQMDADLSHPAGTIPRMLQVLGRPGVDVVVGSRYVAGGSVSAAWPRRRRLLSRAANAYVNRTLRLGIADATSGFKAWRAGALTTIGQSHVTSNGYAFQIELGYACRQQGFGVVEVPIHFEDRSHGRSKMTLGVQLESLTLPWRLRRRGAFSPHPKSDHERDAAPIEPTAASPEQRVPSPMS